MEGIGKPHTDEYKGIRNDWNFDTLYTYITSGFRIRQF